MLYLYIARQARMNAAIVARLVVKAPEEPPYGSGSLSLSASASASGSGSLSASGSGSATLLSSTGARGCGRASLGFSN